LPFDCFLNGLPYDSPPLLAADCLALHFSIDERILSPFFLLLIYCVLIAGVSLLGGWLPSKVRITHTRMQLLMSFLGGIMMGVALLHLLPHSIAQSQSIDTGVFSTLVGVVVTLILLRCFHFHQHDVPDGVHQCGHEKDHSHDHDADHSTSNNAENSDHGSQPTQEDAESPSGRHAGLNPASWAGLFLGLSFHTIMDGVALAASVSAESAHAHGALSLAGLGTFFAIALHKPMDSLSIVALMKVSGTSKKMASWVNVVYCLMCPIGAIACYLGLKQVGASQDLVTGWALGLSAGIFLCIAMVDVLPEVQFHTHDRVQLSAAFLAGVMMAWAIGFLEPDGAHDPPPSRQVSAAQVTSHT
jgi:zinc and cadmium transporter